MARISNKKEAIRPKRKRGKTELNNLNQVNWEKMNRIFEPDRRLILEKLERGRNHYPYTKDILKLLAGGLIIGLSFVFPALPVAIAPLIINKNKYQGHRFNHTLKRLKKQKLVEVFHENGQELVRITEKGKVKALRYKLNDIEIKKPKIWDRKWRMVIFDIPEEEKRMRDIFRQHLKAIGFYQLQESIWVYPYSCFDQVEFLRQIYNVGFNVKYILAEKIEDSGDLADYFNLNT